VPLASLAHNYAHVGGDGASGTIEPTIRTTTTRGATVLVTPLNPKETMTRSLSIFAVDHFDQSFTVAAIGQTEALVAALVATGERDAFDFTVHQVPGVTCNLALDHSSTSVILSR